MTQTTRTALAALLLGTLLAGSAAAQGFERSTTTTGPRGNSATGSATVSGGPGNRTIERSGATSTGRSYDSTVTRSYDAETGTLTRQGSGTTGSGATWNQKSTVVCVEGTCTREGQATGPRGNTTSATGTRSRAGDGTIEGSSTRIGPFGGSRERSWRRVRP